MTQVELHHGAASDVGLLRENNEDAYLVAPPVFVVADGMGGHESGDVASRIVVEEFARLAERGIRPDPRHRGRRPRRSRPASAGSRSTPRREGPGPRRTPGTTVVAALLVEDDGAPAWLLANLGDSRIYAVIGGELRQVSIDHSVVQELVDSGEITATEAHEHPERHVITRALGGPRLEPADFFLLPVTEVERLLLCTDGVSGLVDDDRIAAILAETSDPRDAADRLVAAALRRRGRRQRNRGRGRCGGIGPRSGLRLRATASESRAETGSTAVNAVGDSSDARALLPARGLVRDRRRARRGDPSAHREAAGGGALGARRRRRRFRRHPRRTDLRRAARPAGLRAGQHR